MKGNTFDEVTTINKTLCRIVGVRSLKDSDTRFWRSLNSCYTAAVLGLVTTIILLSIEELLILPFVLEQLARVTYKALTIWGCISCVCTWILCWHHDKVSTRKKHVHRNFNFFLYYQITVIYG